RVLESQGAGDGRGCDLGGLHEGPPRDWALPGHGTAVLGLALPDRGQRGERPLSLGAPCRRHRRADRPRLGRPRARGPGAAPRGGPPDLGRGRDAARLAADGDGPQVPGGHEDRRHRGRHAQVAGRREAPSAPGRGQGSRVVGGLAVSWRYDPELDEIFTDPGERRLAAILTAVQAPQVEPDPAFRSQLRRELMAEAWARAEPRLPWWRRLSAPAPAAWGMATVGALLIAAAVFYAVHPGGGSNTVLVSYNVDLTRPVAAVQPLDVRFTQPMDRASVEQAVQIQPATTVDYQWVSDQEVKITPLAGSFAPNTQYSVSIQPNVARSQAGTPVQQAAPAVFTVAPTPRPTPSATPSATPSPSPVAGGIKSTKLAPAQAVRPAWLSSTSLLLVSESGQLQQLTVSPLGAAATLVASGAESVVARADGQAALFKTTTGVSEVATVGGAVTAVPGSAGALAFGYDAAGKPVVVTAASA